MAGKIQAQFDLLTNSSNAETAVKRLTEQVKAGNAALAQAERIAKETYQSQSLAAKAAGASAETLTKIQQEYFQQLVASRNAAKWSDRLELCQWIREALDKERAYGTRQEVPA